MEQEPAPAADPPLTPEQIRESLAASRAGEDTREPNDEPNDEADFDVDAGGDFGRDLRRELDAGFADGDRALRAGGGRQSNLPALRRERGRWPARLAWLALIVVVGGVVGGTIAFRSEIAASWPASKRLYDLVGMSVEPEMSRFGVRNVKYEPVSVDGKDMLKVEGELVNLSRVPGDAPNIRVKFLDDAGQVVTDQTFPPPERRMLPDEVVSFSTELSAPPPAARRIDVGIDARAAPRR